VLAPDLGRLPERGRGRVESSSDAVAGLAWFPRCKIFHIGTFVTLLQRRESSTVRFRSFERFEDFSDADAPARCSRRVLARRVGLPQDSGGHVYQARGDVDQGRGVVAGLAFVGFAQICAKPGTVSARASFLPSDPLPLLRLDREHVLDASRNHRAGAPVTRSRSPAR